MPFPRCNSRVTDLSHLVTARPIIDRPSGEHVFPWRVPAGAPLSSLAALFLAAQRGAFCLGAPLHIAEQRARL